MELTDKIEEYVLNPDRALVSPLPKEEIVDSIYNVRLHRPVHSNAQMSAEALLSPDSDALRSIEFDINQLESKITKVYNLANTQAFSGRYEFNPSEKLQEYMFIPHEYMDSMVNNLASVHNIDSLADKAKPKLIEGIKNEILLFSYSRAADQILAESQGKLDRLAEYESILKSAFNNGPDECLKFFNMLKEDNLSYDSSKIMEHSASAYVSELRNALRRKEGSPEYFDFPDMMVGRISAILDAFNTLSEISPADANYVASLSAISNMNNIVSNIYQTINPPALPK